MAKPRILVANGVYHVGARGSGRQRIVADDVDCVIWVEQLARVARRHHWHVLSYSLMPNHFHVVVRDPECALSAGMRELNGGFSRKANARHRRDAHLLRNRFWSNLVETTDSLMARLRYVDRNASEAGLCRSPGDWRWGSYGAVVGRRTAPSWLAVGEVLRLFGHDPRTAVARYREFVEAEDERPSPWSDQGDGSVTS